MPPKYHILATILLFMQYGGDCFGHGGYHAEIEHCNGQLAVQPENAELWFRRSRLHYLHGDWKQSLADLDRVESLAPGKHPVELGRAQAWMLGGELQAALGALDHFIQTNPGVADAFESRAVLLVKLGRHQDAAGDFHKVTELKALPEPDDYIAWADACVQAKHAQDAIQALDAGIVRLGNLPALAEKAIAIELSSGNYDLALGRVLILQQKSPRPEVWMAKRASILAQAGRMQQSGAAWAELRAHLEALPAQERNSHAMSKLMEQTQQALSAIANAQYPEHHR